MPHDRPIEFVDAWGNVPAGDRAAILFDDVTWIGIDREFRARDTDGKSRPFLLHSIVCSMKEYGPLTARRRIPFRGWDVDI